jgi:hypothetical protein
MKKPLAVAVIVLVAAGGMLTLLVLHDPEGEPSIRSPAEPLSADGTKNNSTTPAETPEQAAATKMSKLTSASDRVAHLRWVAEQEWARSNSSVLRTTIVGDPDENVQLEAVEVALRLAGEEGNGATSNVVRNALASTKGNTRARGLKAAREYPDANLVPTMIELVDSKDPYATMALNALAHTDSVEAHARIFEVAQDSEAEPKLRERAVALLAITKEREARPLLIELANGEDETLRRIAQEVLKALNED